MTRCCSDGWIDAASLVMEIISMAVLLRFRVFRVCTSLRFCCIQDLPVEDDGGRKEERESGKKSRQNRQTETDVVAAV